MLSLKMTGDGSQDVAPLANLPVGRLFSSFGEDDLRQLKARMLVSHPERMHDVHHVIARIVSLP